MSNASLHIIPGLKPAEVNTVREIIRQNLLTDQKVDVWLFGSRATGLFRRYSDVDLLIEPKSKSKIAAQQVSQIADDFEESELPFKFDVVLADELANEFVGSVSASKSLVFKDLSPIHNSQEKS